jgi:hypothetical protein
MGRPAALAIPLLYSSRLVRLASQSAGHNLLPSYNHLRLLRLLYQVALSLPLLPFPHEASKQQQQQQQPA